MFGAALHAARVVFKVSGGNLNFGSQFTGTAGAAGAGSGGVPGIISQPELARVVGAFVAAPCHGQLYKKLADNHLVVLRAAPGWGRTATAEYLLYECLTTSSGHPPSPVPRGLDLHPAAVAQVRISRLNASTDLRGLTSDHLRPAGDEENPQPGGLLLDVATPHGAGLLRGSDLERLANVLRANRDYLVVTVDAGTVFGDELDEFLIDADEPPPAIRVVARHAARRLGRPYPDVLDEARESTELSGLVDQLVGEGYSAAGLAQLGRIWAEQGSERGSQKATDTLRQWVTDFIEARFADWLAAPGQDPEHRAFVIALAVFDGMPYAKVTRLARDLEDRMLIASRRFLRPAPLETWGFDPAPHERSDPYASQPLFTRPRSGRLAAASAEVRVGTETTRYGSTETEVVAFTCANYPSRILFWLWTEQDALHSVLLRWLAALGEDTDPAVRAHAAAAVGVLASWSFDEILLRVLLPWADDDLPWQRGAVAAALSLALDWRPGLAPVVIEMLRDWKMHTQHPARRLAAIRVWGTSLGPFDPDVALDQLAYLMAPLEDAEEDENPEDVDLNVIDNVSLSVFEIFSAPLIAVHGETDRPTRPGGATDAVLRRLGVWTEPGSGPTQRFAGILAFLRLALHLRLGVDSPGQGSPALLTLCMPGRGDRLTLRRIAELWRRALDEPATNQLALDCLRQWTADTEADDDLARTTFAHLVWESLRSRADFDRLQREFRRWEKRWPRTCQVVLATIERSTNGDSGGL
ncbi:hypothetical protein [Pseudofrankia inefficax]|uniref:Apoptosis regulator Bcl-2 protein BH n=1 Tax=Pseudofrankia inefficax (strain DSM 45817 / CECT 9037 / DDB 130130 / EuI1c) TaxID=298654 RepID=E3JB72_PSEI1|nr:hypothetical protein [Pseudofrankia inefficax]ADP78602.1 apoptosis regulator Bcl-2 protein BH [Pseudofrankia inefficax]